MDTNGEENKPFMEEYTPFMEDYTSFMEGLMPLKLEPDDCELQSLYPYLYGELDEFLIFKSEPAELANAQTEISNGNRRAGGTLQQLDVGDSTVEVQGKGGHSFLHIVNSNTQKIKCEKLTPQKRPGSAVKLYFCSYCRNCYRTPATMKVHERACLRKSVEDSLTDRQCKECRKVFTSPTSLKAHMKMHSGIEPLRCKRCVRKFFDEEIYIEHMDGHRRRDELVAEQVGKDVVLKEFKCVFCKQNFTAVFDNGQIKRRYTCDTCLQKYNSAETLRQDQQRYYSCNRCGRQFVTLGHQQRHQPTCNGINKRKR